MTPANPDCAACREQDCAVHWPEEETVDAIDRDYLTETWIKYRQAVLIRDHYAAGYYRGRVDEYAAQNAITPDDINEAYRAACRRGVGQVG